MVAAIWQTFEARKQQQIAEQRFEQVRKIANSFIFDYHDEIAKLEIWFLYVKQTILKQQGKPETALAVADTGLNLALERTDSDPTNIEPISWTIDLAKDAANLANNLKREGQAEIYRQIVLKYEKQYKEKFG